MHLLSIICSKSHVEWFQSICVSGLHPGGSLEQNESFGLGFRVQGLRCRIVVIWNSTEIEFYGLVLSLRDCILGMAHVFDLKV